MLDALEKAADVAVRVLGGGRPCRVAQAASVANDPFPAWLRPVVLARFVLATLGSALVLVLLRA
ncbi:hypothetical protein GCM10023237_30680 [Streptomyces coeruleoprunus]